jgi:hypothetical protein
VQATLPSLLLTAGSVGPVALFALWLPPNESNFAAWSAVGVTAVALSWHAGLPLLRHPLWDELVDLLRRTLRRADPHHAADRAGRDA